MRRFYNAQQFNQPLADWDTSGVGAFYKMFYNATEFNQPFGLDTSSVTDMESMFKVRFECPRLPGAA